MSNFQTLTCPNCQGTGCPTCKNTGQVRVSKNELQKLKQMMSQSPASGPIPLPQARQPNPPITKTRLNTSLAGIITFSIFSIIAGAATASWYFLKSFKPFLAGFFSLLTIIGARLAWKQPFFQPQQPNDFLAAINKSK